MIHFADMTEFHQGHQFFMFRPSRAAGVFIIVIACAVIAAMVWAFVAQMDDVIKAAALLRPAANISQIKTASGGEVLAKNYQNDMQVTMGAVLLQFDASADILDYENSQKFMERLQTEIIIAEYLLETIKKNDNTAPPHNNDAYIRSQAYIIEYRQLLGQLDELETKLSRERALPESMIAAQRVEDIEQEIAQARLRFDLWRNNKLIETSDSLKQYSTERETLERRLSDLERNIKNATVTAPISGRINEIRALNKGDYVLPGEQILNIVPSDADLLKAELYIDPAYIARVKTGQKVSLRFPGLPPSKFGKLEAEVSIIPADYMLGLDSKPAFVVEAMIAEPYLTARTGERILLRAGIGAEGRIIIAQDTVMNMVLKKLDFMSSSMEVINVQK